MNTISASPPFSRGLASLGRRATGPTESMRRGRLYRNSRTHDPDFNRGYVIPPLRGRMDRKNILTTETNSVVFLLVEKLIKK